MGKNKLLWAATSQESIEAAQKNRWYFIGPDRVIAYGRQTGGVLQRVSETGDFRWTQAELQWLEGTIGESVRKTASAEWQEIVESQEAFKKRFEAELEAERRRGRNGDGQTDAERGRPESESLQRMGEVV